MATPPADVWKKAKDVEFTVQKEQWGSVEVEEDVVVRVRSVLTKLQKLPPEAGQPPGFATNAQVMMAVDAPFKLRKQPTLPPPTQEQVASAERVEVTWRALDEPWNEYIFDDSGPKLLKMKLVVSGVMRLQDLYDQWGAPFYQLSHTTVVAPAVARKVNPGK